MASIYKTDIIALKKLMVEKEIATISDLSKLSGINRNTLSSVLNGDAQPSAEVMDKLVSTLDIEPEIAGCIFFSLNLRSK
ncbi:helix-turn-helix transcriptional regulator [Mobilitalea sibirica]|uniref:Helix-turn-helix transcriptional regulator n=1 Tax=Mobilitalea sibirica TaxID=1462919 RepID=A0A8J7HC12_9FIRM|nr:helix-turn-helix transcriptional regulator [Mobilitalea sibirica]MBH1941681.1 helix-turn-helix transcriptional regulator [Mobilitalea sibirica]